MSRITASRLWLFKEAGKIRFIEKEEAVCLIIILTKINLNSPAGARDNLLIKKLNVL